MAPESTLSLPISFRYGSTLKLTAQKLPGSPFVVVDTETANRLITVLFPK